MPFDLFHEIGIAFNDIGDAAASVIHDVGQFVDDNIVHPISKSVDDMEGEVDRFAKGIESDFQSDFSQLVNMPTSISNSITQALPKVATSLGTAFKGIETGLFGDIPIGTIVLIIGSIAGAVAVFILLRNQ